MRLLSHVLPLAVATLGLTWAAPAQATITPYGVSCGPVLTGEINTHHSPGTMTLRITHGSPHGDALMAFGVNPLVTPLPNSSCLLLTEAYHLQHFLLNGAGRATWRFTLPPGFSGEARMQMIEVLFDASRGYTLSSSNGIHVVVPPV